MSTSKRPRSSRLLAACGLLLALFTVACTPEEVQSFNAIFKTSHSVEQANAACAEVETKTGPGTCTAVVNKLIAEAIKRHLSPRELGRHMAAERGWTGANWEALDTLWGKRESGWNPNAVNPDGGACGIPQAKPCSKMKDKSVPGQIDWGLDYIAGRYGTPVAALAHSYRRGWY